MSIGLSNKSLCWKIKPSKLSGKISLPTSKSQSMRALLFALMAKGRSRIEQLLVSPDVEAMITACRYLGASINHCAGAVEIVGINGLLAGSEDVIDAGNSGLLFRLVGAIAGLSHFPIVITGDASIRYRRPIAPLLNALSQLGVEAYSTRKEGGAPIVIRGPLQGGKAVMDGADSQPVSGMLIASAFANGPTEIEVRNEGEKPWIDLTLDWFKRLGINYQADNYQHYRLNGKATIDGFEYVVPSDFSSLAYPLVAALLTHSEIQVENLAFNDPQGDKEVIFLLQEMGASIEIDEQARSLVVKKSGKLEGALLDINHCIDALPILAVVGCFAMGSTHLKGGAIARYKESDRISTIVKELKKMGAQIEENEEGLTIFHSPLRGAELYAHHDHRIALSLAVAALGAQGESCIRGVECVDKSYPHFHLTMQQLGAKMELL